MDPLPRSPAKSVKLLVETTTKRTSKKTQHLLGTGCLGAAKFDKPIIPSHFWLMEQQAVSPSGWGLVSFRSLAIPKGGPSPVPEPYKRRVCLSWTWYPVVGGFKGTPTQLFLWGGRNFRVRFLRRNHQLEMAWGSPQVFMHPIVHSSKHTSWI